MKTQIRETNGFVTLFLASLALAAFLPSFAQAETIEECVDKTITRGSERSKRQELNDRCENTWENYKECKEAAADVRKAVEQHQKSVRATCAISVKNSDHLADQTEDFKSAKKANTTGNAATITAASDLEATNKLATKGKRRSEEAIKLVLDDDKKVKPERRPILKKILSDFANSSYSGVSSAQQYMQAMKKIDEAWKSLQSNSDMGNDQYADAYDATATYLNAEEVRLGSAYQKNQMAAASTSLTAKASTNEKNTSNFGETKSDSKGGNTLGTLTQAAQVATAVSGLTQGTSTPTPVDTSGSISEVATNGTDLNAPGAANNLEPMKANGSDTSNSERSKFASTGNILPGGKESDVEVSSSASRAADTSLRDSLKKKLLSAGAGGEDDDMPAASAVSHANTKEGKENAPLREGAALEPLMFASGSGSSNEFNMSRSETDEAVNDLLAGFKDADKNEYTPNGNYNEDSGAGSRKLASVQDSAAGIEGKNSSNLFTRVRSTVSRCLKKGCVVHGLSNSKI